MASVTDCGPTMVEPRIRPWTRLSTVRARTTLVAALAVGLALILAGVAVVTVLRRALIQNVDELADFRAEDVAALARQDLLPRRLTDPGDEDAAVQVVDDGDNIVAATGNLADTPRLSEFVPPGNDGVSQTLRGVPGTKSAEVRVLALRSRVRDVPVTIYVATSLEPLDETLGIVRRILLVGGPVLFVAVSLVCWIVVGRALRPVTAIRREAADINATELARRVPEPPTLDEIGLLARTINKMLARIEHAAAEQRRFVSDASHELRSPIAATRADLEVALAHPDRADWSATAAGLLDDNRRLDRLVQDLLFLARSDEGEPRPRDTLVDLDDVVLSEVARFRPGRGPAIDVSNVSAAPVLGHREDLSRLVRNLVENGHRHAENTVTVRLAASDGQAVLTVADDGPGIPPDARDVVFERFARLDAARDVQRGGSGLGLAIVREIVQLHGGSIEVATAPGGGAMFTVRLPSAA